MKIIFVGQSDRGMAVRRIGGSENCYRRLGRALERAGHNISYIIYGREELPEYIFKEGDTVLCSDLQQLSSRIENSGADLVNVGPMTVRGRLWGTLLRLKKKGVKITTIYWMYPIFTGRLTIKLRSLLFNFLIFDAIFGGSPRIVANLRRNYLRAFLLPPPIDEVFFVDRIVGRRGTGIKNVGYIGRIGEDKGIEWFLKQDLDIIDRMGLDLKIYGYWDESDRASYRLHQALSRKMGRRYISSSISHAHIGGDQVSRWLESLDLLILPYKSLEGTIDIPLILLEACAKGCRVAINDLGDARKYLSSSLIPMSLDEDISMVIRRAVQFPIKYLSAEYRSDRVAARFINYTFPRGSI